MTNQTTADPGGPPTETTGLPIHPIRLPTLRFHCWYWTEAWQRGERQAEEDIRAGRVETFDSMDDFLDTLD